MTRLFTEGFETADLLFFNSISGVVINSSVHRSGSYCCALGHLNTGVKNLPSPLTEFYLRFGILSNYPDNGVRVQWRNGTSVLGGVGFGAGDGTGSSTLRAYVSTVAAGVGDGTTVCVNNTWYLIEAHVILSHTIGLIEVKLNGQTEITYSGDTIPGALEEATNILFYSPWLNADYYDDIALNDTNGTEDNSWCGDGHVVMLFPMGSGAVTQLSRSTGSMPNWELVNERPPNAVDYVSGSLAGQYDLYIINDSPVLTLSPKRIWVQARSINNLGNENGNILLGIREGNGTEDWGENIPISGSYSTQVGKTYKITPSGSTPFSTSDINGLQIGIKTGV